MEGFPRNKDLGLLTTLAYCLIHGVSLLSISIVFFYIMTGIPLIVTLQLLVIAANFITFYFLILGLISLSLGFVNVTISKILWSIDTRNSGRIWFIEGLIITIITQVLFIPLPFLQTILLGFNYWFLPIIVVILFLDYSILFGLIGRKVAQIYYRPAPRRLPKDSSNKNWAFSGTRARCPRCHASFRYHDIDRALDGTVVCFRCNYQFYIEPIEVLMEKLGEVVETNYRIDL